VEERWTLRLSSQFCPVSSYFLHNYYRLRPHEGAQGLTSTEAMTLIQIIDHKWDRRAPWPTLGTLAKRLGSTERTVRATIKRLEALGYIQREYAPHGGPNRYHLDGLFKALEQMMDADLAAQDAQAAQGESAADQQEAA
jgi:DNA-binding MarR family transcriptional regulator